jgi:GNAT superfamily N-acetyltransferase
VTISLRAGTPADSATIADLASVMFAELGTSDIPVRWRSDLDSYLRTRLGDGVAAFLAFDAEHAIGLVVGIVDQRLPSPRRPDGRIGYVEWLVTLPSHRRQGVAAQLLDSLVAWFAEQGVAVSDVHASAAAEPLYRSRGYMTPNAIPLRRRS